MTWEYKEPYDIYDVGSEGIVEDINLFLEPQNGYFAVVSEEDDLLGFCNFGVDAQVPGGDYRSIAIDIGSFIITVRKPHQDTETS